MKNELTELFAGEIQLDLKEKKVSGELISFKGESYYKISNYDQMPPFFMSLTSDSDVWTFISSKGGLSAGRKDAEHAMFPYYTDDKITDLSQSTGSKTIIILESANKKRLWIPFSDQYKGVYKISRNLYKNVAGNKLIFEECNYDLGLTFQFSWMNSRNFGVIKMSELINNVDKELIIHVLDGIENILPYGISTNMQQTKSNLANAYKKAELREESGLGIYSLSSNIIDRPEPSEALKATTVGFTGLEQTIHLLSSRQVADFQHGSNVIGEKEVRAEPGAYFVSTKIILSPKCVKSWIFSIDSAQSASRIVKKEKLFKAGKEAFETILRDIETSTDNLNHIIAQVDGLQLSADKTGDARHISNTLFNVMRGGFFADGYHIDVSEFIGFIQHKNKEIYDQHLSYLSSLPSTLSIAELKTEIKELGDNDVYRCALEYLPITFSRRHGDPSRPWNKFNINVLQEDGGWKKSYEGNWRDIFQNWEALCFSFPEFIENTITLFLNASTIDGYNPYRITNRGIEWEIADPDDPWSFIGYWGDHQIIYLLKLLELSQKFHHNRLYEFIDAPLFTFSNVPYRIKRYSDIVKNPYDTIIFDEEVEHAVVEKVNKFGADGKLIWGQQGRLLKATLSEKLLIPLLTKLSNFVPEGGIWMNTQRPEWNDANNALVGHGLSMVTVYYIYRYLNFLEGFYKNADINTLKIEDNLKEFIISITKALSENEHLLIGSISDNQRKVITDALGSHGEKYRNQMYQGNFNGHSIINTTDILDFINASKSFIEHTIANNKGEDNLYHSYNLLEIEEERFGIKKLYPMLEGQVAVLSSQFLRPEESLDILSSLRGSNLYRKDQNSYILYPDRRLSLFMDKGIINESIVQKSKLLTSLIAQNDTSIIIKDINGRYRFNPDLSSAKELHTALEIVKRKGFEELAKGEEKNILSAYESVFNHHSFTGRSGTFFGYEGLGSIYWHMNSKLLLAVQENFYDAIKYNCVDKTIKGLKDFYYEIKEGLGMNKNPKVYGAFPIDPYSHTPAHKGAQQPGMTGQVKEDIISRYGELGLLIKNGRIEFTNDLIKRSAFLTEEATFEYFDLVGEKKTVVLEKGMMAFTFCQVPIVYKLAPKSFIEIHFKNDEMNTINGHKLPLHFSEKMFGRTGEINHIKVGFSMSE